ncbi:MAG: hypothetical protein E7069_03625 [Bacteroidales bacterium]|nr:hypothetical protein [Bacteroidales bacterium]
MSRILIGILMMMLVVSCRPTQYIETVRRVEVRDTLIVTKPDTASLHALIECDSLGNLLVREIEALQGERAKVNTNVKFNNHKEAEINTVYILQPDTVYVPMYREKETTTQTVAPEEKPDLWFAWLLIGIIIGCLITFKLIR